MGWNALDLLYERPRQSWPIANVRLASRCRAPVRQRKKYDTTNHLAAQPAERDQGRSDCPGHSPITPCSSNLPIFIIAHSFAAHIHMLPHHRLATRWCNRICVRALAMHLRRRRLDLAPDDRSSDTEGERSAHLSKNAPNPNLKDPSTTERPERPPPGVPYPIQRDHDNMADMACPHNRNASYIRTPRRSASRSTHLSQ